MGLNNNKQDEDIDVERKNVDRKEQPSVVGATFIKYATYIALLVIVLYFIAEYILPRF